MSLTGKGTVFFSHCDTWATSVPPLLEDAGLGKAAASHGKVLIKPNLVKILAPPITTPVSLIEAIVDYLLHFLDADKILIGEGNGSTSYDSLYTFHELGYTQLSQLKKIRLVDLNEEPLIHKKNPECQRLPEVFLPEILDDVFLLSVPQLKAHSLSGVTLTMKNMMGCAPPSHYQAGGGWKKSAFHNQIQAAIFDLNRYRTPDFTLLDATIGMAQAHLWGPQCDPPVGQIVSSFDPVAIDSYGAGLLKRDWQKIGHIAMAHTILGDADNFLLEEIGRT